MVKMSRRVVLVTGGTRGIGAKISEEFAKNDYNVVVNYANDDNRATKIKEELENKYSIDVLTYKADVSDEIEVENMINEIIDEFGRIDCVVNNAGIAIDSTFDMKTASSFRRILDVNLVGPFLISKCAYKYLKEQKNSSIINISSTNGIDTIYPESMDYDASKAGLISLTKNLAIEFAPDIRVNSVAPGWTKTDMTENIDPDYQKQEESKILLNRFAEPEEIANVVVFLASDEASYINGEVIRVDGGFRA